MKKIFIISILTLAMTLSFPSFAVNTENFTINSESRTVESESDIYSEVTVTGTSDSKYANKRITLSLLRPDVDINSNLSIKEKFAVIHQGFINSDGSYSFTFNVSKEETEGNYTIRIMVYGAEDIVIEDTIYISDVKNIKGLVNSVYNKEINETELSSKLLNGKDYGINSETEIYAKLPEETQNLISSNVLSKLTESSVKKFIDLFKEETAVLGIGSSASGKIKSEIALCYQDILNLSSSNYYANYDSLTISAKETVLSGIKNVNSLSDVLSAFEESLFINSLSKLSHFDSLPDFMTDYEGLINSPQDILKLNNLSSDTYKYDSVLSYILKQAEEGKIDTIHSFVNVLNYSVNNVDIIVPPVIIPSPSQGGTTGGNSFGGSSSRDEVSVFKDVNSEIPEPVEAITVSFSDLGSVKWAEEAINNLVIKGVLSGKQPGLFYPEDNVTRVEFVKMLSEALNFTNENSKCDFDDVDKDYWGYKYIASLYSNGIISGKSERNFAPSDLITRQEISTVVYRAMLHTGQLFGVSSVKNIFEDYDLVSNYAKNSVLYLSELNVISGYEDRTFRPQNNATRAEAAVIIQRMLDAVKEAK